MKFKIGDRVKMNEKSMIEGKVGYIVAIDDEDVHVPYLVEVPGWHGGHDGDGIRKDSDSCWWVSKDGMDLLESKSEQVGTAEVPTAEAEDNTTDIMDAENPKRRLMAAYEKFEAAIRQQDEACEEIAQIVQEMRNK